MTTGKDFRIGQKVRLNLPNAGKSGGTVRKIGNCPNGSLGFLVELHEKLRGKTICYWWGESNTIFERTFLYPKDVLFRTVYWGTRYFIRLKERIKRDSI